MIKNVLIQIGDVGVYGAIALSIFFAFFGVMLVWAFRLKSPYLDGMSELPLQTEEQPSKSGDE